MKMVDSVFNYKIHIKNRMDYLILKIISGSGSKKDIIELEELREFGIYPKTVKFK
jgi:hypothetical protein